MGSFLVDVLSEIRFSFVAECQGDLAGMSIGNGERRNHRTRSGNGWMGGRWGGMTTENLLRKELLERINRLPGAAPETEKTPFP